MATYYKPRDSRILIAKRMSKEDDRRTTEFLGSASWAANCVSRWIRPAPSPYGDELQPRHSNGEAICEWFSSWGVVSPTRRLGH